MGIVEPADVKYYFGGKIQTGINYWECQRLNLEIQAGILERCHFIDSIVQGQQELPRDAK